MTMPNESKETRGAVAPSLPEVALAKGVLVQAKQDLRRFAAAQDSTGGGIYADAYSWVTANDFAWPYSFLNVCKMLRLSPELLRAELLSDPRHGWVSRSRRIAENISSSFRGSLAGLFGRDRNHSGRRHSSRPVLAH